ncbi:MAG: peptide deformylase [Armatimonadota bacterium]
MSVKRITICGEPILRKKCRNVQNIDQELIKLLDDMAETMSKRSGIGLAAPQVDEDIRVIVAGELPEGDEEEEEITLHRLINPRIIEQEGEVEGIEGCLSLPTLHGTVLRPGRVVVEAITPDGDEVQIEGEGLLARCLSHEIDHLNGTLFIDRVEEDSLAWMVPDEDEESGYRWVATTIEEARARFEKLIEKRRENQ